MVSDLSRQLTDLAIQSDQTWPYVFIRRYDTYLANAMKGVQGVEMISIDPIVLKGEEDKWIEFANRTHEAMVAEGHMIRYGNLDKLSPKSYSPRIRAIKTQNSLVAPPHEFSTPFWMNSPPLRSYSAINWDISSVPQENRPIMAMLALENTTTISPVLPLAVEIDAHQSYHSTTPYFSKAEYPHSFMYHPIFEKLQNGVVSGKYTREKPTIVGMLSLVVAWDASMRNLLPNGLPPLVSVIKNTCGQEFSFRIHGRDAIFLGESDLHDHDFASFKKTADLSWPQNALAKFDNRTCRYEVVRSS